MILHAIRPVIHKVGSHAICLFFLLLVLVAHHGESSASNIPPSNINTTDKSPDENPGKGALQRSVVFANNSTSQNKTTAAAERITDWDGIKRDTAIIFGGQAMAAAITYILPESFSGWTTEQKKDGLKKYSRNFVHPVMDKDAAYINYGLHPYWGATYYTRARERGLDSTYSFAYSVLLSTMYEFGTECFAEKPSIQDIFVTPIAGSLLGAYVFEPLRDSIKRKQELRWYDHALLVTTDPLGVLSLGVEKLFGIKSTVMVDYSPSIKQNRTDGVALESSGSRINVVMQFPLK